MTTPPSGVRLDQCRTPRTVRLIDECADSVQDDPDMSTSRWSTEEFCYLCGERFVADVHPSRVFPPQFGGHAGGLLELKTHPACEREFQEDEEYFFTTLLLSQPVLRPLD